MPKLKAPLLSLEARGRLSKLFSYVHRAGHNIIERKPIPTDAQSSSQLFIRHMFTKCVDLWHLLSEAEKQEWESAARPRHMTGYAWYISQCLRPNPGIYLPLQGGNMQGIIDMDTFGIQDLPDPTNPQDADTQAARDAAIALALADCIDSHIHAWDGSAWQKLRTQTAVHHNLRTTIFYDGSPAQVSSAPAAIPTNTGGLIVDARLRVRAAAGWVVPVLVIPNADGQATTSTLLGTTGFLYGFDGTNWDRLRTYGTGILKVGRAEIGLSDLRRTNAGQVKAGAGKLYWMTMNPSAAASVIELTDDLDGSTAVKWDMTHGVNSAHHMNLDPPLEFATGIWCKTLTNFTSIIFGYK